MAALSRLARLAARERPRRNCTPVHYGAAIPRVRFRAPTDSSCKLRLL